MALEVFPQELFGYGFKDLYNLLGGGGGEISNFLSFDGGGEIINHSKQEAADTNWDISSSDLVRNAKQVEETNSSSEIVNGDGSSFLGFSSSRISEDPVSISTTAATTTTGSSTSGRRKRRRAKSSKNKEEVENQRMTHIAVERNRRRQMNEYLAVLRSLMPPPYVQRGDQASIIGGAINFVKELEQLLQSLESQKQAFKKSSSSSSSSLEDGSNTGNAGVTIPFANFFTYPQYSSHSSLNQSSNIINSAPMAASNGSESLSENHPRYGPIADIEVTMVESHASLKILTKRRPKQLLRIASGFQTLRLNILHLNVTSTVDQLVLYSFSVKVEEDCKLTSGDEIATAVYQMLGTIQDETCSLS